MCQVNDDDLSNVLETKPDFRVFRKCLKCDENSVVVTRISEALCKSCFLEYFTHKFRATVGKNVKKLMERDEIILFAYSASGSSVAMLNLLVKGVGDEAKKKLTFKIAILYIEDNVIFDSDMDQCRRIDSIKRIAKSCEYSNFKIYFSLFENCLLDEECTEGTLFSDDIGKLEFNAERTERFLKLIKESGNDTSKEELLKRLKLKLISRIARRLKIEKVMLATNCTKLTIDLLSNVSIGKGAHISSETSLDEKKADGLIYIRPLRELTSKEIAFYNHYTGKNDCILSSNSSLLNMPNSTIYRLTEKFINGLQHDFPTTVSTLFRTSDKLTPSDDLIDSNNNCILCDCPLDTMVNLASTSSAINDLEFSKFISKLSIESPIRSSDDTPDVNDQMAGAQFCYSCMSVVKDLKNKNYLPEFVKKHIRDQMKNQINEFLIDEE